MPSTASGVSNCATALMACSRTFALESRNAFSSPGTARELDEVIGVHGSIGARCENEIVRRALLFRAQPCGGQVGQLIEPVHRARKPRQCLHETIAPRDVRQLVEQHDIPAIVGPPAASTGSRIVAVRMPHVTGIVKRCFVGASGVYGGGCTPTTARTVRASGVVMKRTNRAADCGVRAAVITAAS
jgi:hypothetical protein